MLEKINAVLQKIGLKISKSDTRQDHPIDLLDIAYRVLVEYSYPMRQLSIESASAVYNLRGEIWQYKRDSTGRLIKRSAQWKRRIR